MNGKAIMTGIFGLKQMEASDMVDVFHVMFEEDSTPLYDNHAEAKSHVRETIYRELYGKTYKYAYAKTTEKSALGFDPNMELPEPSPEQRREVKPYFPPTDPEDFARVLSEPPLR